MATASQVSVQVAGPAAAGLADYRVELDAGLVEEATLRAVASLPADEQRLFRRHRDPLYEMPPGAGREAAFQEIHGRWLARLGLAGPIYRCLSQEPAVPRSTCRCLVLVAPSARDEYADLYRTSGQESEAKPVLILRLRPQTLVDSSALVPLLQRELLHIADLVDPGFGFDHDGDGARMRPALVKLVRERYRELWDTTVDGRLAARGWLSPEAAGQRRRRFLATFGMLGEAAEPCFEAFFRGARPSHGELLAFASSPSDGGRGQGPSCCSLCQLPTTVFHRGRLSPPTLEAIRRDFADWTPDAAVCPQCAELYQSRVADR